MYHLYINSPDGTLGNCKPSQLVRAAIMTPAEYCRIRSHMCWSKMQGMEERERNERIRKFKECSQKIVKTWRNTLLNKQLEREEKRRKRLSSMENFRNAQYQKSCIEKENQRQKILQDVRDYFMNQNEDIRDINAAYVFTQILREREEQLKFRDRLRAKEQEAKEEYDERVKKDVECFLQLQKHAENEKHKAEKKRGKELLEQILPKKEQFEEEYRKKELEKLDLTLMKEEMELIKENTRAEAERRKAICINDLLESRKYKEDKANLIKQNEEDQEKSMKIYHLCKRKIDCLTKKQISTERQEREEIQDTLRKEVWSIVMKAQSRMNARETKAIAEKDASSARLEKQKEEKKAQLRKERQVERVRYVEEMERNKRLSKELALWERALSCKKREVDKLRIIKGKEEEWKKKMETRKGYNVQITEKREKQEAEKKEALRELCATYHDDSMIDEAFYKYAKQYLDKIREQGANDYPIVKKIEEYRRRNGFHMVEMQDKRRKADKERWKAKPCGGQGDPGLEKALTVWKPTRSCPLVCSPGLEIKDDECVKKKESFNLPRVRSSDICGKIRQEILMRELAQKGLRS